MGITMKQKKPRVCAYCRVSTEHEEQQTSIEAQVSYYTEYIKENDKWEFAGVYEEKGISGTNAKNRPEFNRMIKNCIDGKIDMIITKSISRFMRNTLECIKYIRLLKEKGVSVYFEKENLDTKDSKGEFIITLLGGIAQEESRTLSLNTKWGIIHRFQQGIIKVNHNRFLGYTKNRFGELVVIPEEAKIVERIFTEYLEGKGSKKIADGLTADNILTPAGCSKWYPSTIIKILGNEKYIGNALLQKTITLDFLTKKRIKNTGQERQYYVENNHEPIITKEVYIKVQQEKLNRRSTMGLKKKDQGVYKSEYALSGKIKCSQCGKTYHRCHWTIKKERIIVWRCGNRQHNGPKACQAPTIYEKDLLEAIDIVFKTLIRKKEQFIKEMEDTLTKEKELTDLSQKEKEVYNLKDLEWDNKKQRLKEMKEIFETSKQELTEYNDLYCRRLIEKILVISEKEIQIEFKSGIVMNGSITTKN